MPAIPSVFTNDFDSKPLLLSNSNNRLGEDASQNNDKNIKQSTRIVEGQDKLPGNNQSKSFTLPEIPRLFTINPSNPINNLAEDASQNNDKDIEVSASSPAIVENSHVVTEKNQDFKDIAPITKKKEIISGHNNTSKSNKSKRFTLPEIPSLFTNDLSNPINNLAEDASQNNDKDIEVSASSPAIVENSHVVTEKNQDFKDIAPITKKKEIISGHNNTSKNKQSKRFTLPEIQSLFTNDPSNPINSLGEDASQNNHKNSKVSGTAMVETPDSIAAEKILNLSAQITNPNAIVAESLPRRKEKRQSNKNLDSLDRPSKLKQAESISSSLNTQGEQSLESNGIATSKTAVNSNISPPANKEVQNNSETDKKNASELTVGNKPDFELLYLSSVEENRKANDLLGKQILANRELNLLISDLNGKNDLKDKVNLYCNQSKSKI
jgi:hypothetical protein